MMIETALNQPKKLKAERKRGVFACFLLRKDHENYLKRREKRGFLTVFKHLESIETVES